MKKMLLVALLGLGLALVSAQRASAWSKYNFGVGLSLGYEGGGNSVLWGMFKGEQPPMPAVIDAGPVMPGHASPAPKAMPQTLSRAVYSQTQEQPEAAEAEPTYAVPSYWYGR